MASARCQELSSQKKALAAAVLLELRPVVRFACPDYAGCFPIELVKKGATSLGS